MKVTGIKATPLAVPFQETHVTWTGSYSAKSTLLVEVFTDEGIIGLGEGPNCPTPEMVQIIIHEIEDAIVGFDPFLINAFHQRALSGQSKIGRVALTWRHFRNIANIAFGAIDMALWDIVGKATGQARAQAARRQAA